MKSIEVELTCIVKYIAHDRKAIIISILGPEYRPRSSELLQVFSLTIIYNVGCFLMCRIHSMEGAYFGPRKSNLVTWQKVTNFLEQFK